MRLFSIFLLVLLLAQAFAGQADAQDKHTLRVCNETQKRVTFDIVHTDGVSGYLTESYVVSGPFSVPTGQCISRIWGFSGYTIARGWLDLHVDGKHESYEQPVRSTAREKDRSDGLIEGVGDRGKDISVCIPPAVMAKWKEGGFVEEVPIPELAFCNEKEKIPVNIYFSRNGRVYDFTLFVRPGSIGTSIKSSVRQP